MTIEAVATAKGTLFINRRPTQPIGTQLPPDAPAAYARSQLGPRTIAWMKARGWLDRRTVARLEPAQNGGV